MTIVKSMGFRGGDWNLMKANGWRVGDVLEDVENIEGKPSGPLLRIKIVRIATLGSNCILTENGKYRLNHPRAGEDGTTGGIVTFCEWPVGGGISATSLNCRNWDKVA